MDRAWNAGLSRILVPGVDIPTSQNAIHLAEKYSGIFAAVGVHPNSSKLWDSWTEDALESLSCHEKVMAIGEIGLDYYRDRATKNNQITVFKEQLGLAAERDLPVVIHTRNKSLEERSCIADLIDILSGWDSELEFPGVVHSYSGNIDEAQELIRMGYFLGITGPITYKNASELREVVAKIPLERLLIETDGPFLSPQQKRGKRNEPAYVRFIAEKIATVRGQPLEEVINQVQQNAAKLFGWEQ